MDAPYQPTPAIEGHPKRNAQSSRSLISYSYIYDSRYELLIVSVENKIHVNTLLPVFSNAVAFILCLKSKIVQTVYGTEFVKKNLYSFIWTIEKESYEAVSD